MMTSLAFILGVVPLVLSEGAGAEMRQTLGTAVFSGMLGVTLFGIFLTPVFYYVIQWFSDKRAAGAAQAESRATNRDGDDGGDGEPAGLRLPDQRRARPTPPATAWSTPPRMSCIDSRRDCRMLTERMRRADPVAEAARGPGRAGDRGQHRLDRPDLRGGRCDALAGAAAGFPSRRPPSPPRGPGLLGAPDWQGRRPPGRGRRGAGPRPALVVQHQGDSRLYRRASTGRATP